MIVPVCILLVSLTGPPDIAEREASLKALIVAQAPELLDGYRFPTKADIKHDWAWFEKATPEPAYWAAGDVNADGKEDYAFVLLSSNGHRVRVAALVSSGGHHRPFTLDDADPANEYLQRRYVVAIAPAGRYTEVQGPEFVLAVPAIDIIYTESSERLFVWQAEAGGFREIWLTE